MSKSETHDGEEQNGLIRTTGPMMTRRNVLRAGAAGGGAVVLGSADTPISPVGQSEALVPAAFAVMTGAVAVDWALREWDPLGSEPPPDGLGPDALHAEIVRTSRDRQSENGSTIVDNSNIINGIDHVAYSEAKIAAIESLNDDEDQSTAQTAATDVVDDHFSSVLNNVVKSWNEAIQEAHTMASLANDHSELDVSDVYSVFNASGINAANDAFDIDDPNSYDLPDGTTVDVYDIANSDGSANITDDPADLSDTNFQIDVTETGGEGSLFYLRSWRSSGDGNPERRNLSAVIEEVETLHQDVTDDVVLWLDTLYNDVEAGDIDTSEILSPTEHAELMADGTQSERAIADLLALNIPVRTETSAEITLHETEGDYEISALALAYTAADASMETGQQYDPDQTDDTADDYLEGDVYVSYEPATAAGSWDQVGDSFDNGTLNFTAEPDEDTLYQIETAENETYSAEYGNFTEETDGNYSVSFDEAGNQTVSEINAYLSSEADDEVVTTQLTGSFTIEEFTDGEGTSQDSVTFERDQEPQDDTNYLTQEEWDDREQAMQEQIDAYEEAQNGGGGLLPDFGDFGSGGIVGGAVAIVGGIFVVSNVLGD